MLGSLWDYVTSHLAPCLNGSTFAWALTALMRLWLHLARNAENSNGNQPELQAPATGGRSATGGRTLGSEGKGEEEGTWSRRGEVQRGSRGGGAGQLRSSLPNSLPPRNAVHCFKLSSTTRLMSSTGACAPVNSRNWSAACPTNMESPVTTPHPAAAASLQQAGGQAGRQGEQ